MSKLTPEQKIKIRTLYETGNYSERKLVEMFNSSKGTIGRIIKGPAPKMRLAPNPQIDYSQQPIPQTDLSVIEFPTDPLSFRENKFKEISVDLEICRSTSVMGSIGSLHKLQIDIHDQWVALNAKIHGMEQDINEDDLLMMIEQAFIGMPPSMREKLFDSLANLHGSNIVPISAVE
jgi:hypothetical protein